MMRHQGLVQKRLLPPRTNVKCQSLFSCSSCYFLYLRTGKGRLFLVYFDPNHMVIVWTIVIILKAGALRKKVRKLQVNKMCRTSVTSTHFYSSFYQLIRDQQIVFGFQLLIQKGMNEGWYISSVGPTLYRDGLERLIISCSHCFLSFFLYAAKKIC